MKVVLAALLLLCPLAADAGKIRCANTTGRGTLAFISTSEPGEPPTLTFVDEGYGGDPDLCLSSPSLCAVAPCLAGSEACAIDNFIVGDCYDYLLSACGSAPPAVRTLQHVSAGPCP